MRWGVRVVVETGVMELPDAAGNEVDSLDWMFQVSATLVSESSVGSS